MFLFAARGSTLQVLRHFNLYLLHFNLYLLHFNCGFSVVVVVISCFLTLEQFVSRRKYDRNVTRNRLKSWFMYFGFRIKILKGNPCVGLLFEVVHTMKFEARLQFGQCNLGSKCSRHIV